jgi:hypothetical protein
MMAYHYETSSMNKHPHMVDSNYSGVGLAAFSAVTGVTSPLVAPGTALAGGAIGTPWTTDPLACCPSGKS